MSTAFSFPPERLVSIGFGPGGNRANTRHIDVGGSGQSTVVCTIFVHLGSKLKSARPKEVAHLRILLPMLKGIVRFSESKAEVDSRCVGQEVRKFSRHLRYGK